MKILLATDGSKSAQHAAKYASKLLGQMTGKANSVTLISVHDDVGLRHAKAIVGASVVADYLREQSDKEMKPVRKVLDAAGIKHDMIVRTGHVAQEIVDCAKAGKFDLIVLGAKGRGALADMLLGSVAQRVLSTAHVPVLVVR